MARFNATPVDVVLTDINMVGVTGIELLERIRAVDRETPVILMTAYAELDMAVLAIKKGRSILSSSRTILTISSMLLKKGSITSGSSRLRKTIKRNWKLPWSRGPMSLPMP